jgi:hypothetical protein
LHEKYCTYSPDSKGLSYRAKLRYTEVCYTTTSPLPIHGNLKNKREFRSNISNYFFNLHEFYVRVGLEKSEDRNGTMEDWHAKNA